MNASEEARRGPDHAQVAAGTPDVRHSRHEPVGLRWESVPVLQYKEAGTHFKSISRQVLFDDQSGLTNEVRYFEIWPGGHSTLERHEHVHAVVILSGRGRVLVGDDVYRIAPFDLVHIPPRTWHQFRAAQDEGLGFLCMVPCERDRPERPSDEEARALREHPVVGDFIRI